MMNNLTDSVMMNNLTGSFMMNNWTDSVMMNNWTDSVMNGLAAFDGTFSRKKVYTITALKVYFRPKL
jgi:hypothetical protein